MRTTQQFGITLPIDMAEAMEHWLREEIVAGHAEYHADPSRGVSADEVLGRIKSRRRMQSAR